MTEVLASDLTREHAQALLRLEKAELKRLLSYHERARREILGRLLEVAEDTFTAQRYRVVLAQVTAGLRELEKRLGEDWSKRLDEHLAAAVQQTLAEIAVWEPRFGQGPVAQVRLDALRRVTEQRALLLHRFETSMQRYGLHLVGEVQRRLGLHIAMNSPWRDMALDVAGRLRAHGIAGSRWRAERIVRTELVEALSAGHQAALEASAEAIPGLQRQWDATLDSRTSRICETFNARVRGLHEPFGEVRGRPIMRPPAHPSCRSRLVAFHPRWV